MHESQGVLRECLLDSGVECVLSIGRSTSGQHDAKLREIVHKDIANLAPIEDQLTGYDACFGRAMIKAARYGALKKILESQDINAL